MCRVLAVQSGSGHKTDTEEAEQHRVSTGSYTAPYISMSKKELFTVSSAILTDHPNAVTGSKIPYEFGNYFYLVDVLEVPGDYYFFEKLKLTSENQSKIKYIRKGLDDYE